MGKNILVMCKMKMVIYVVRILYLFTAEIGSWNIHCELALVS